MMKRCLIMSHLYSIGKAAEMLGVSIKTVREWDKKGFIKVISTPGGHRRIEDNEINRLLNRTSETLEPAKATAFIYCRVSTKKQADSGNLERQEERLLAYAYHNHFEVKGVFKEIASGINENRKQLLKMLDAIRAKEVQYVIIEYKDRLARFGYNYLNKYIKDCGVDIIIVNQNDSDDIQKELVEDLIAITTSFSARIYGQRGGKKITAKIKNVLGVKDDEDCKNTDINERIEGI